MAAEIGERIAVVGGGSWGTAFAAMLAEQHGDVSLWVREPEVCDAIRSGRENRAFLPGVKVPEGVLPTTNLGEALAGREIVALAVPSLHLRDVAEMCVPHLVPGAVVVSLAKGLENGTLLRMTEVLAQVLPLSRARFAVLSGPTFARAVAAGMSDGLGFGDNARALLVTRGLAEISRVGVRLGADPQTFYGLSGLGDLVLTCTGDLSRNRTVGVRVGNGERVADVLAGMTMVAEGVMTAKAAADLSRRTGVAMPISEQVHLILHEGKDVRVAVTELLSRALRREKE